jgi:lysozyme
MKKVNHLILAGLILTAFGFGSAQTVEFQEPWKDARLAIVIDPYQGNAIVWPDVASDPRVVGIIHRATIGSRKDTKYAEREAEAKRRGYKWGSYHLGKPGDPITQADFYLGAVKPSADEVIALDIEGLDPATDMNLANARRFIRRIKKKTGRYPMIYANQTVVKRISDTYRRDAVFSKTPLWYARFKSRVTDFPTKTWDAYTLWQFSSEINCRPDYPENCLYRVPGTEMDMDVNVYRGTVDDLKANWPFNRKWSSGTDVLTHPAERAIESGRPQDAPSPPN